MKNIIKQQLTTPLLIAKESTKESIEGKRQELKAYFLNSWQTYEALFSLINNDHAFYKRPESLRHPLIFYFGHTATFYINKLILGNFITHRINEKLEAICAVGVDEMSWDDLDSKHYDWPKVDEVRVYRNQVAALICQLIDEMELSLPITQDSLAWIILMGSEHERIHLETSSVIMRMLPLGDLTPSVHWAACCSYAEPPQNNLKKVAGKNLCLGKANDDHTYGWDNEYGQAHIHIPDFSASQLLVSNKEYLSFVQAGGYENLEYWTEEGQQWLTYKKAKMPHFWLVKDGVYYQRNLFEEIALPMNWPVEVNYLEAKAFCHWLTAQTGKNIRLPTEPEWYLLREKIDTNLIDEQKDLGNTNLEFFASSCPVNQFETNGFYDVIGNVWQWTESPIDAYDGFKVHPLYDDFSTPTFDTKHNVMKGGSWISTGNEIIKSSRYAFRRHFYQHAGFRYVASDHKKLPIISVNQFETDFDVCQQLQAHYGPLSMAIKNYQQALANQCKQWIMQYQPYTHKLLDLGCSVGRTSFELAPLFEQVDGVDFSARYIQYAAQLQLGKKVRFESVIEGDIVGFNEISLAALDIPLDITKREHILFSQGDASNLKAIFNSYDVVLAQQVIEQCYNPKEFLNTIMSRLKKGGLLIIASNYQFDQQIAAKEHWLGGMKVNGENVFGFDGVKLILSDTFELLAEEQLPQLLAQSARHFTLTHQHISVWRCYG